MKHIVGQPFEMSPVEDQNFLSEVADMLVKAYFAETETMMNYIKIYNNLTGLRSEPVKEILKDEIEDEFKHANLLANRLRVLGFVIPGSMEFRDSSPSRGQRMLSESKSLESVIDAIIEAECEAMDLYKDIIEKTADKDPVTADLVTGLLADEENHYRTFTNLR